MEPMPDRVTLTILAVALSVGAGCQRDDIAHARVPKSAPTEGGAAPAPFAGAPTMPPPGMAGDVPPPPTPTGSSALKWKLPKGWSQSLAGGMRYATLKPAIAGHIDVSVVVLPGSAGGELANVNRWRGQIGLPPIDEPALATARKTIQTPAGTVSLYDFTSEGKAKTRMVAGLLSADGNSWFIKMVGDADPVGSSRADFIRFLETLRFD
jgi:hypothetical protein